MAYNITGTHNIKGKGPTTLERAEDIKLYQKSWLDHLERLDRSCLHRLDFNVNRGEEGMLETPQNMERSRTP
jgi:hypothetical protein